MNWPPITAIDAAPPASAGESADEGSASSGEARRPAPPSANKGRLEIVAPERLRQCFRTSLIAGGYEVGFRHDPAGLSRGRGVSGSEFEREIAESAADGLLVVIPTSERVHEALPGPMIGGVPAGVVTADTPADLRPFLHAISRPANPDWAVFAMGKDAYLAAGEQLLTRARRATDSPEDNRSVRDCRADRCSRPAACQALARGPSLAIYAGHGQPHGWSGYQALRWKHVAATTQHRQIGAIVHLACHTGYGSETCRPFAARFVTAGRAGASLASYRSLRRTAVMRLAELLGVVLETARPRTIGEILLELERRIAREPNADPRLLDQFCLIGSPLQPIR